MPTNIYTYEQAKATAKKVIITAANVPQPVPTPTPNWMSASVQPAQPRDEMSELAKAVQELNKRLNSLEKPQSTQYAYGTNLRPRTPWGNITCFNCMEPGHTAKTCTLHPVPWDQAQANRLEVRR